MKLFSKQISTHNELFKEKKVIISRCACLGHFTSEYLFPRNCTSLNFQKNRVDYAVRIHKNKKFAVSYDKVAPYILGKGNTKAFLNYLKRETQDMFAYQKCSLLIMDSFSELTDKLFINKTDKSQFLMHYSDVDFSGNFYELYDCAGALPIDKIASSYDAFFSCFNAAYGDDVPIIFLPFPTDFDKRNEYKERGKEILSALAKLSEKYKNLHVVVADFVEKNPADNEVYHFSSETYKRLAMKISDLNLGLTFKSRDRFKKLKLFLIRFIPFSSFRRKLRAAIRGEIV